jgi:hypothetical protein
MITVSPEVKRLGREAGHSPPSSAEVNSALNNTSTPTHFMAWCLLKHGATLSYMKQQERDSLVHFNAYVFRQEAKWRSVLNGCQLPQHSTRDPLTGLVTLDCFHACMCGQPAPRTCWRSCRDSTAKHHSRNISFIEQTRPCLTAQVGVGVKL